jgi:hypothetical protein
MQEKHIKEGRRVKYTSRANSGTATILSTKVGKTGLWATVFDRKRNTTVSVRASQLTPA